MGCCRSGWLGCSRRAFRHSLQMHGKMSIMGNDQSQVLSFMRFNKCTSWVFTVAARPEAEFCLCSR